MSKKIVVYDVETGVPIQGETPVVPLNTLGVDQSVLFELSRRNSVQAMATRLKNRDGKEFTIRKVSDTEARVWRTK